MKHFLCTAILSLAGLFAFNQPAEIDNIAKADSSRLVSIFKNLHVNPELGFMETRTAGILAKELKALGFQVKEGLGQSGVVGILKNGNGPIVMYRADMNCNATASLIHACGHDEHVTSLIGVAKLMVQMKNQWRGTLILHGQPEEEPALDVEAMVNDGHYSKHSVPQPHYLPSTDQVDIVFNGIEGHGSYAKDPIVMAASAIVQYQIITGSDNNVIPSQALVKVNLHWFNDLPGDLNPTVTMKGWVYPRVNSDGLTEVVIRGIKKVIPNNPVALNTGKDFCYIVVGVTDSQSVADAIKAGRQVSYANNKADYKVELVAIPMGIKIGVASLVEIFNWATAPQ